MFKVGDIIVGKKRNPYAITHSKSVCKVTEILDRDHKSEDKDIEIKILSHQENEKYIGSVWDVHSQFFKLKGYPNLKSLIER